MTVATTLGGGRAGGGSTGALGGFTITQYAPILAPTSGGGTPINLGSPDQGGSPSSGGRGQPTLGLSGPIGGGVGSTSGPSGPGGTSGIVAGFGQLAENLPRFNYTHIALFLALGLGLYLLWPRISRGAGKAIGKARG